MEKCNRLISYLTFPNDNSIISMNRSTTTHSVSTILFLNTSTDLLMIYCIAWKSPSPV